jgi:hypothetical protein
MKPKKISFRANLNIAQLTWGVLTTPLNAALKDLTQMYGLSVAIGDLQLIDGRWYVTHAGLLRLSTRERCRGIRVARLTELCEPTEKKWVFKATVFTSRISKGFVGYGDAEPSNVSFLVHGAEMRIAETRAVNRALRKAYGIGICSVEELGSPRTTGAAPEPTQNNHQYRNQNGSNNGQPRLRDQLRLLIRDYKLDPMLVKAYAADFCGTATLSGASRELVESFISHLSTAAKENRESLVCKLNSYAQPAEAHP